MNSVSPAKPVSAPAGSCLAEPEDRIEISEAARRQAAIDPHAEVRTEKVSAVRDAIAGSRLILLDEIGRMELCSEAFQDAVVAALDSPKPVLGTIQARRNAFLDAVRGRDDVELLHVTEQNRDEMKTMVLSKLDGLLAT